jgi:hypothetical protein
MRRVVRVGSAVILCSALVTACSDTSTDRVAPAGGTASPGATAATDRPSPGASGGPAVGAVPDSDLPELEGYTYARAGDVPDTVPGLDPEFVAGYVGRAVLRDGDRAGVVQLVRLRRTAEASDFADAFVRRYAQTGDFESERLAGRRVRTTSLLRGRPGGLVTWLDGRDLVLVYAGGGVAAARRVARSYLGAS